MRTGLVPLVVLALAACDFPTFIHEHTLPCDGRERGFPLGTHVIPLEDAGQGNVQKPIDESWFVREGRADDARRNLHCLSHANILVEFANESPGTARASDLLMTGAEGSVRLPTVEVTEPGHGSFEHPIGVSQLETLLGTSGSVRLMLTGTLTAHRPDGGFGPEDRVRVRGRLTVVSRE